MATLRHRASMGFVVLMLVAAGCSGQDEAKTAKLDDSPKYDRTAILAEIDAAIVKAVDPNLKSALESIRLCADSGGQILHLKSNQLTALPPEIWLLTNLEALYVASNQLTTLPPQIGTLTKLMDLQLPSNQITTLPPEIGELTHLTQLYLGDNQLAEIPREIGKLTKLTSLDLENNPITDAEFDRLKSLEGLTRLNLIGTKVTEEGAANLKKALPSCEIRSDF